MFHVLGVNSLSKAPFNSIRDGQDGLRSDIGMKGESYSISPPKY